MGEPEQPERITLAKVEESLLGRPASMGRREVSREAQVSLLSARRFWHAMGFQEVQDDDAMFTEADLRALSGVADVVRRHGVDEDVALAMTRAFARTADRLSVWQTQLIAEAVASTIDQESPDDAAALLPRGVAETAAAQLMALADDFEPLLVYVWRRHLTSAISRMLQDAQPEDPLDHVVPVRVVGFADLVSFTELVRSMSERQLARLVQRFEELASDIITTHGGRIIKTVGDEVLFVHRDPAPAAAIALDLVEAIAEDPLLPDVRVALAQGKVVSRLGDVFGTTVNRASRLTAITPPGAVFVDEPLAASLRDVSGFRTAVRRPRTLRGIGPVTPARLRRSTGWRGRTAGERHP